MSLYVGFDDTDSLRGMCTTYLAAEVVRELADVDLIGYPRLVRLNPNVPWKTRGNGAICLRVGRGRGRPWQVGDLGSRPIPAYPRGESADASDIARRLAPVVERWSALEDPTTNPGLVVLTRKPPPGLYWRAIRGIVRRDEATRALAGRGLVRGWKNGRGIIGAAAACAWRPRDRTYEVLAYREPGRWGSMREIDLDSVKALDHTFPSTFNNYDPEEDRVVITPRSPCPVLFGIRGDDPRALGEALRTVRGERPSGWLLFETNQGTDDHVGRLEGSLRPRSAYSLEGTVVTGPRALAGGHVVFRVRGRFEIDATVYEPAKTFRRVALALAAGDRVRIIGSTRESPKTLNVEKIEVVELAPVTRKIANPRCSCGKSMKSMGREAGYRCARCRQRAGPASAKLLLLPRRLTPGWYEPPVGGRRHISKPLQRFPERTVVGRQPI